MDMIWSRQFRRILLWNLISQEEEEGRSNDRFRIELGGAGEEEKLGYRFKCLMRWNYGDL